MKVKVGDKIYDSKDQPVMVILEEADKSNISLMDKEANKYCSSPDEMSVEEVREFMRTPEDENQPQEEGGVS